MRDYYCCTWPSTRPAHMNVQRTTITLTPTGTKSTKAAAPRGWSTRMCYITNSTPLSLLDEYAVGFGGRLYQ